MYVVARATFTQLLRMKIFLFLLIFALIVLLIAGIKPDFYLGSETSGIEGLTLLKNTAFGGIRIFGLVFCVLATALIIPKDTEDRILYTILSKPVHRIDYLVGKALGVIALTVLAMVIMDAFMSSILWFRTDSLVSTYREAYLAMGHTMEDIQPRLDLIYQQGVTWSLHAGIAVLALECVVLTSMTLLLSCITGGTIISALLASCVYLIGIFQSQAKIMWLGTGGEGVTQFQALSGQIFTVLFPNFGIFSISDSAINGQPIAASLLGQLALITLAYFVFQLMLSAWIFRKKEF